MTNAIFSLISNRKIFKFRFKYKICCTHSFGNIDGKAPYYRWINNLCQIFLATKEDHSPIPQMKREFMEAVLDLPSNKKSNQSSIPFPLHQNQTDENKQRENISYRDIKSTVVTPTCSRKKMSTSEYVQSVLSKQKNWKPRGNRKVVIQPSRKVAPVQPFRKTTTSKSGNKSQGNNEDSTRRPRNQSNISTQEQIEMDRQMAEDLQETYVNENNGIISLDPNFTSDDDMSNYNWEDSGFGPGTADDGDNDGTLPDLPAEATVTSEEISQDPTTDVSEAEMTTNEEEDDAATVSYTESEDDRLVIDENMMTVTPVLNEEENTASSETGMSTQEGNNMSNVIDIDVESQVVMPLSIDFMDSLSVAYDQNPTGLFDSFAETKLFDGKGIPITTTSLLTEENYSDVNINEENAVYMDVMSFIKKDLAVLSSKKENTLTSNDNLDTEEYEQTRKKLKMEEIEEEDEVTFIKEEKGNVENSNNRSEDECDGKSKREMTNRSIRDLLGMSESKLQMTDVPINTGGKSIYEERYKSLLRLNQQLFRELYKKHIDSNEQKTSKHPSEEMARQQGTKITDSKLRPSTTETIDTITNEAQTKEVSEMPQPSNIQDFSNTAEGEQNTDILENSSQAQVTNYKEPEPTNNSSHLRQSSTIQKGTNTQKPEEGNISIAQTPDDRDESLPKYMDTASTKHQNYTALNQSGTETIQRILKAPPILSITTASKPTSSDTNQKMLPSSMSLTSDNFTKPKEQQIKIRRPWLTEPIPLVANVKSSEIVEETTPKIKKTDTTSTDFQPSIGNSWKDPITGIVDLKKENPKPVNPTNDPLKTKADRPKISEIKHIYPKKNIILKNEHDVPKTGHVASNVDQSAKKLEINQNKFKKIIVVSKKIGTQSNTFLRKSIDGKEEMKLSQVHEKSESEPTVDELKKQIKQLQDKQKRMETEYEERTINRYINLAKEENKHAKVCSTAEVSTKSQHDNVDEGMENTESDLNDESDYADDYDDYDQDVSTGNINLLN